MALKRRSREPLPAEPSGLDAASDELAEAFPTLWSFLTQTVWPDDGSPRCTGTALLFLDRGQPKVRLVDKESAEYCFLAGETFWEALQAADRALDAGRAEWRPDKGDYSVKKTKKPS